MIPKNLNNIRFFTNAKKAEIVRSIRNEGNLVQLTFQQIYNIRNYEKAKRLGDTKMNLKEFIEWCENNSGIPDDEDEAFILNFGV